jgi:hypothetical protein
MIFMPANTPPSTCTLSGGWAGTLSYGKIGPQGSSATRPYHPSGLMLTTHPVRSSAVGTPFPRPIDEEWMFIKDP